MTIEEEFEMIRKHYVDLADYGSSSRSTLLGAVYGGAYGWKGDKNE